MPLLRTHNIFSHYMFSSRDKKTIIWVPPLICSYAPVLNDRTDVQYNYPYILPNFTVYYSHQSISCTGFLHKILWEKRCSYVEQAVLFNALLTKFPYVKACHIALGSSWKWPNSAGYESKQAKFTIALTDFSLCSSVTVGLNDISTLKLQLILFTIIIFW